MLIRRTVLANTTDSFPVNGRYFSLIQGSNCRVNLLNQGSRIFSSEVYQGMGSKFERIDIVEIESPIEQVVEYWLGESEYRYTPPALRALKVKASQVAVSSGVFRLVTDNAKRMRTRLTFRDDCFVGGDDLALDSVGKPINGIPMAANTQLSIESAGSLNVFVSTREAHEFVNDGVIPFTSASTDPSQRTVGKFTDLGVGYVDVDLPAHLVNTQILMGFAFSAPSLSNSTSSTNHYIMMAQSNAESASTSARVEDIFGTNSRFSNLPPPHAVNGSAESNRVLKYKKTRIWVYSTQGSGAKLESLTFKANNWQVIHTIVDVIEETL